MDAYVQLLIKTCHKRGVHAMGGMAAQIPIKNDPAANEAALNKVCAYSSTVTAWLAQWCAPLAPPKFCHQASVTTQVLFIPAKPPTPAC